MNFKDLTIEYCPTIVKFLINITYNHPKKERIYFVKSYITVILM
jgi:hypothetical protein